MIWKAIVWGGITDEEERLNVIKEQEGLPKNWKPDEALEKAFEIKGKDAKVAVIPDGLGVVVNM